MFSGVLGRRCGSHGGTLPTESIRQLLAHVPLHGCIVLHPGTQHDFIQVLGVEARVWGMRSPTLPLVF